MIFLVNTFITDKSGTGGQWERMGIKQDRGNLRNDNKFDILKYTLASWAKAYPWKKVIINAKLDNNYFSKEREKELENFVREEYSHVELHYSNERNVIQSDWEKTYELLDDDLIHYFCTHDHVFIDFSSDYFVNLINKVKLNHGDKYLTIALSHWSEFLRNAKWGGPNNTHSDFSPTVLNENYKLEGGFLSYDRKCFDSIHIISKNLYEDWFLKTRWDDALKIYPTNTFQSGHIELPRIEGVGITDLNFIRHRVFNVPTPMQKIIVPYKEIARHFDGYYYHGITNNQVPSLDIPIGFFEKNIKIRHGYSDRKEGWVNVNPMSEFYYAANKLGSDYKFTLQEIPMCWKDRISEIDINPNINEEEMIQYRLKSVLEMIYTSRNHDHLIEKQLETNILNEYLKIFGGYSIEI